MYFLWALITSLSGSHATATDAPPLLYWRLSSTRTASGNNCTWQTSHDKGMEGGQPLTDLTEQLNWNYQSVPLSSISSFILSCIIHFSHSQLQEFISPLSFSLPVMLPYAHILSYVHVQNQHKNIASLCHLYILIIPLMIHKYITCLLHCDRAN